MNIDNYCCLMDEDSKIFNDIDKEVCNILRNFAAIEIQIPALIEKDVLKKVGYFESFPDQIVGITSFKKDLNGNFEKTINDNLYLTPSACLHLYPIFGEKKIDKGIFTTKARVYRNEKKYDGKFRLNDFTVREIVVVGKCEFVKTTLNLILKKLLYLAENLGLMVEMKNANDPFYPSRENEIKRKIQVLENRKFEMIVNIDNELISIGSLNFHGTHFSKAFDFDNNGSIVTGCIGIGLERWVNSINLKK